jgi:tetratricopeptide (TPR) repeat protein
MIGLRAIVQAMALPAGLATLGASASAHAETADPSKDSPLIAYVLQLPPAKEYNLELSYRRLKAALFEMDHRPPPPGPECSHTLGAERFSDQYIQVATSHEEMGDLDAAMEATNAALACTPRDASLYLTIANLHLLQGRVDQARAALLRGANIDPDDRDIDAMRARIDFIQQHWADAAARFRAVMTEESGGLNPYWQLFYWLSQRRAGVRTPELPQPPPRAKHDADEEADEDDDHVHWPAPVLATVKGEQTEAQLVELIRDSRWESSRRQWLTEALYYVGELRLAEGEPELARRYFAAVVILKVSDYVEYGMARAELARMSALGN